jgi:sirohydrochlorin ferrochelatase
VTGIVLFAHGSTVEDANDACRAVTDALARREGYEVTATAFLDCAAPALSAAIEDVVARGATSVIVVPYFLTLGIHLQRDLPQLIEQIRSVHPGLRVEVTEPLDGHPALVDIVAERARDALKRWG